MTTLETLRNPLCEFALTLADLNDPFNYHSMYHGSKDEDWLPFFVIEKSAIVDTDAFIFPLHSSSTRNGDTRVTWRSANGEGQPFVNLDRLGIIPFDSGLWSDKFAVANDQAFKYIGQLLAQQ